MQLSTKLRSRLLQARRDLIKEGRMLSWSGNSVKKGDYSKILDRLLDCYEELKLLQGMEKSYQSKIFTLHGNLRRMSDINLKYKGELRLMTRRYELCSKQRTFLRSKVKQSSKLTSHAVNGEKKRGKKCCTK